MKHNFTFDDTAEEAALRFLNGDMPLEEMEAFDDWINSSPDNRRLFQSCQEIWLCRAISSPDDRFNPNTGWKKIQTDIKKGTYRQKYVSACRDRRLYFRIVLKAAIFIALIGLGALLSWLVFTGKHNEQPPGICEIIVPAGSRSQTVLPDGSKIWLNAGSSIKYDHNFNNQARIVELSGEAHFDINTNPHKPFIVRTSHLDVKALGTIFNVRAYPEDDEILTTLVDGKVIIEIFGMEEKQAFTYPLEPKQNFTYRKSGGSNLSDVNKVSPLPVQIDSVDEKETMADAVPISSLIVTTSIIPELYTSWKDDEWIIKGESLESMAVLLSRRYNTSIDIKNHELKEYRFTGTIRNETLEQVLEILRLTTPLRFEVGKGEVTWQLDRKLAEKYDSILERKN
ncbi:MAG: FecR family protein [Bacteroidales bacterium]